MVDTVRAAEIRRAFMDEVLRGNGRVVPSSSEALQTFANDSAMPGLGRMVATFTDDYLPPARRERLRGSGHAVEVSDFTPGAGSGFNADRLELVLGRPEGAGDAAGSFHVVSLGVGGQMTLKLGRPVTRGVKVFENGFGSNGVALNPSPARVEVSADGRSWFTLQGHAGLRTVQANSRNGVRMDTTAAGGEVFLFADSSIPPGTAVTYVRITDLTRQAGPGAAHGMDGFDLDAVWGF